jgi:NADP-dependent 3-hydroxy acid dehydrogenase YdfG
MTALALGTALVTGASRGIGLEVARALVDEGLRVAMLARSERDLRARAHELGPSAIPLTCDVGDEEAVRGATARAIDALGGSPEIAVNNAGVFELARVDRAAPADFRRALDVNLVAPFLIVHALLPAMREHRRGHIVTIGSIADRVTFPENGAYAASKFGLRALHQVLVAELHGSGVRATLVSPGPVDTALWDEVKPDEREGFTPRKRMLSAAAVAAAVRFAVTQPADVNVDELRLSRS